MASWICMQQKRTKETVKQVGRACGAVVKGQMGLHPYICLQNILLFQSHICPRDLGPQLGDRILGMPRFNFQFEGFPFQRYQILFMCRLLGFPRSQSLHLMVGDPRRYVGVLSSSTVSKYYYLPSFTYLRLMQDSHGHVRQ